MIEQEEQPEKRFTHSSAQDVVEWYRGLGQFTDISDQAGALLDSATVILRTNPNGFYLRRRGEPSLDEPYMLDAASMIIEASRFVGDKEKVSDYRKTARGMLHTIYTSEEQLVSVRVDALMYSQDLDYLDASDRFLAGETDFAGYEMEYKKAHVSALSNFRKAMHSFSGKEGFSAGKMMEWYVLLGERQRLLMDQMIDAVSVRSSYLREDGGKSAQADGLSDNFDIVFEELGEGDETYRPTQYLQLKVDNGLKERKYRQPIKVRRYIVKGTIAQFVDGLTPLVGAFLKQTNTLGDHSLELAPHEEEVLNRAYQLLESYQLENSLV